MVLFAVKLGHVHCGHRMVALIAVEICLWAWHRSQLLLVPWKKLAKLRIWYSEYRNIRSKITLEGLNFEGFAYESTSDSNQVLIFTKRPIWQTYSNSTSNIIWLLWNISSSYISHWISPNQSWSLYYDCSEFTHFLILLFRRSNPIFVVKWVLICSI